MDCQRPWFLILKNIIVGFLFEIILNWENRGLEILGRY